MSKQLDNKHEIRPRLGSFWYEQIAPDQERSVLSMQHVIDHSQAQNLLQASGDWALNAASTVENDITVRYDPRDVEIVDGMWELPLAENFEPVAIMKADGDLILRGIGFDTTKTRYRFYAHPDTLFNGNRILVKSAKVGRRNILSYTLQIDEVNGPVNHIEEYYRGSQSPAKFELALAQATGLKITPEAGFLLNYTVFDDTVTIYEFSYGEIVVPYAHDTLALNTLYPADMIIGDQVAVNYSNVSGGALADAGYDLYDNLLDWSGGLCLNRICPIEGIAIPDIAIDYVTEAGVGGNFHLRFEVQYATPPTDPSGYVVYDGSGVLFGNLLNISSLIAPDAATGEKFIQWLFTNEERSGLYLNSLLPVPHAAAGEVGTVNLLKLLFQKLLGRRGLAIDLKTHVIGADYHRRALKFIQREKPIGSIPIIRILDDQYAAPGGGVFDDWDGFETGHAEDIWNDDIYWSDAQPWVDE